MGGVGIGSIILQQVLQQRNEQLQMQLSIIENETVRRASVFNTQNRIYQVWNETTKGLFDNNKRLSDQWRKSLDAGGG